MEALNVVKDISACIGVCLVTTTIDALALLHLEESRASRIVGATADTDH